jgi:hypothetical protein
MTVSPTTATLVQGGSVTATLTLALKGPSPGTIRFMAIGPGLGVSAAFNPPTVNGSGSTTVTLTAASDASIVTGASMSFFGMVGSDTLVLDGFAPHIDYVVRNARPAVTIVKAGEGTGTVTSNPAGIDCGSACSSAFDLGPITLTAVPAVGSALTSWSGTCSGTGPTCTFTPKDFGNSVTATFAGNQPGMSLAVSPSLVSVQAGGSSSTAAVTVTRVNGFVDPATLAITAPPGLTVSANPSTISGTTSTLTFTAASSLAAGSYTVTIGATGSTVTAPPVPVAVQVQAPASGGSVVFNYSNCEANQIPIWFAAQNGTGAWTRIMPTNNSFTFSIGTTGAYAIVTRSGPDTTTSVLYGSVTELSAIAAANPCGTDPPMGTKRITGIMVNPLTVAGGVLPTISIGQSQFTKTTDTTNAFTLTGVPSGPRDLIAARINPNNANQNRMVIRRSTNYANNTGIPPVDYVAGESFIPRIAPITALNLGADQVSLEALLITPNGPSAPYYSTSSPGSTGNIGFAAIPDSMLQPRDVHDVSIFAAPASGSDFRVAQILIHSASLTTPASISFGPRVSGVAVTTIATAPYLRMRGQVAAQTTYSGGAIAEFDQGNRSVSVGVTASYLGSAPSTWSVDVPDLSAAGYDPAWGLKSGQSTSWQVEAAGGDILPFVGGNPTPNAQVLVAGAQNPGASSARATLRALTRRRRFG